MLEHTVVLFCMQW